MPSFPPRSGAVVGNFRPEFDEAFNRRLLAPRAASTSTSTHNENCEINSIQTAQLNVRISSYSIDLFYTNWSTGLLRWVSLSKLWFPMESSLQLVLSIPGSFSTARASYLFANHGRCSVWAEPVFRRSDTCRMVEREQGILLINGIEWVLSWPLWTSLHVKNTDANTYTAK